MALHNTCIGVFTRQYWVHTRIRIMLYVYSYIFVTGYMLHIRR